MNTKELVLKCLTSFMKKERLILSQDVNWQELVDVSNQQKLLPIVYDTLCTSMPENIRLFFKMNAVRQITIQTQRTAEFLKTYRELSAKGVVPVVVKGIVCRSTYDIPEYRVSADEDLYVPIDQYPAFHNAMLELGFVADEPDYKNAHEQRFNRNGLLIEGHWELFPKTNNALNAFNEYTAEFWRRTKITKVDGIEVLTLEPTDHMIFLLLHAFKHFVNSGVGVRQICDVAQWAKVYEINWQYVKEVMESVNAEYFSAAIFDAGSKYFGMVFPEGWVNVDSTALLEDALDGGIYGSSNMSRKHSGNITLGALEASQNDRKSVPLMTSLFPNRSVMEMSYPWVKKSAMLLPAAWCVRIVKYLSQQGHGNSASESLKIGSERIELLKQYKII